MAVYYVGAGGNDANNGLTWATRKLTLNGAENVPVVAGDTVYVAPGVYRETLTCDVSGGAGTPITYIGDVSGENTDGVGGVVRVTASDNDQTNVRNSCITDAAGARNYRTFRGFTFDSAIQYCISQTGAATNWIVEDCIFLGANSQFRAIPITVRRCIFISGGGCLWLYSAGGVLNSGNIVEDCIFLFSTISFAAGLRTSSIGGITVRNCSFLSHYRGIIADFSLVGFTPISVNDCIFYCCTEAIRAVTLGDILEDYNNIYYCSTPRTNVAVGANSNVYLFLPDLGILHSGASQVSGFRFPPPLFGALSQWSQVRAIADTGAATEDILGLPRPVTAGKRSWGAVQYVDMARDTATVHAGTASKKLADAGRDQIYVPAVAVSTVFSVYVYREANYAGVNPQMIIKQPGQADTVVTDAGAAGAWNQLTTTLTPAALPGYVVVELVSNNTAAAGNYAAYFDDLTVV